MAEIALTSEVGVDYTNLRDLLAAQKWSEADFETLHMMLSVSKMPDGDYVGDMSAFPCSDLQTIDQLWVKYSNGHFGFSVQKQIWYRLGGQLDIPNLDFDTQRKFFLDIFSPDVGWKKGERYLNWEDLIYSLDVPAGQLPAAWVNSDTVVAANGQIYAAWVRLKNCNAKSN